MVFLCGVCILCCSSGVPLLSLYIIVQFWCFFVEFIILCCGYFLCSFVEFVYYAVVLVFVCGVHILYCKSWAYLWGRCYLVVEFVLAGRDFCGPFEFILWFFCSFMEFVLTETGSCGVCVG